MRRLAIRAAALALCLIGAGAASASAAAPEIVRTTVSKVTTDSVLLQAEIDPQSLETSYHFEYGPEDCELSAYEQVSPVKKNDADARGMVSWAKASSNQTDCLWQLGSVGRRLPHGRIRNAPLGGDIRLPAPKARQASARAILALAGRVLSAVREGALRTPLQPARAQKPKHHPKKTSSARAKDGSPDFTSAEEGKDQGATDTDAQGTGKQGKQIQPPKGAPKPTATPAEEAKATVADIVLTRPSIGSVAALPATHTCDGKGS